jgi:hypothetical protein
LAVKEAELTRAEEEEEDEVVVVEEEEEEEEGGGGPVREDILSELKSSFI